MRIAVAGGTGFVGSAIVRELLARGHEVTVTSRRPDPRGLHGGRVKVAQAFAGDGLSLARAFTGAEVVIHTIQFPHHPVEDPARGRTYLEVDGRGTGVSARAARAVGVRRFVYLSGAGAGQDRPQRWFRAKDLAEAAIHATGCEGVMLRPSWIYGPGDHTMNRFAAFCRYLPVIPQIGDGTTPVYPLHVDDVARMAADAALREDAPGRAFELGGDRLTIDEVVRTIQRVIGRRRPIVHHPAALMKLLAWPLTFLPEPPLSPGAVEFITGVVEIDPRPARDWFGGSIRPLEDGLRHLATG